MTDRIDAALRPARERCVLSNGLVVLVMERRHLPIVSATLLVPAGTLVEPEEHPGLAFFTSHVLPMGTGRRSATILAEDVDALGATLGSGCDHDFASIEVTGLSRTAESLVDILAEVALTPAFLDEEIERRRSQILGILERRKNDYAEVVKNRFSEMVYGPHPYRRTREGNEESIARIGRREIVDFFTSNHTPAGAILSVVGDVDAEKLFRSIEGRFGGWRGQGIRLVEPTAIPIPDRRHVATIQKQVTQAYLRVGNIGIERTHPDFHAAVVMNYILGGAGFGSRLMRRLREEKGLTYGAYSNFWIGKQPGYFFAGMQTGLDTMNVALAEMLSEIERFVNDGVTEEELSWAKKFLSGSLPLTLETNEQIAQRLLEQEFFGLPEMFWLEDLRIMQSVTAPQVLETARRQIDPARFAMVVLADFREHPLELPVS